MRILKSHPLLKMVNSYVIDSPQPSNLSYAWNFGSLVSLVSILLFLYIIYIQLVEGKATSRYPWLVPQFYSDSLQTLLARSYNSLEWCLSSPPKPHAFTSLPLQSKITFL